jgi:hypothetical protein
VTEQVLASPNASTSELVSPLSAVDVEEVLEVAELELLDDELSSSSPQAAPSRFP